MLGIVKSQLQVAMQLVVLVIVAVIIQIDGRARDILYPLSEGCAYVNWYSLCRTCGIVLCNHIRYRIQRLSPTAQIKRRNTWVLLSPSCYLLSNLVYESSAIASQLTSLICQMQTLPQFFFFLSLAVHKLGARFNF